MKTQPVPCEGAALNQSIKVACLGPRGTFSEAAVLNHFGAHCSLRDCGSIDEVFLAVENREVDYGVVPVENSTEGAVNNTQDCLIDSSVKIVGEEIIPIVHHLMVSKQSSTDEIREIVSHRQPLAQCRRWLQANYPATGQRECASTAEAAHRAQQNPATAAIAGELAAKVYDLDVRHAGIQDRQHNSTRFLVLANADTGSSGADKTSILIYTENKPGALFRILEPFENLGIGLTRIETRPSRKEAWEYVFFIDFEGHVQDENVKALFGRLASCAAEIKILGSYPSFAG